MSSKLLRTLTFLLTGVGLLSFAPKAQTQSNIDGPIRIVVPYSAGSAIDIALRLIGQKILDQGGPALIIENKPGGAGVIAATYVKQSAPDGKTLFLCDLGTFAVNKTFIPDLTYDPLVDFKPITPLWSFPSILVVPTNLKAQTITELVELAKRTPGGLSYGSQGVASTGHLRGAILAKVSGAPLTHVPYRGGPPAVNDLVAGRIDLYMTSYASVRGQVEAKLLRILGASASKRLKILPDVPTLGELGYPAVDVESWFGLAAPGGTPDSVTQQLNRVFVGAITVPDVVEKLALEGVPTLSSTTGAFKQMIEADIVRLKPIVEGLQK